MKENQQNILKSIIWLVVVAYLFYLTFKAISFNYQTNKKIKTLQDEIALLQSEEQYLKSLNVYYATSTYKELEARRKLGLKKKGEKVIKVPVDEKKLSQYEQREALHKPADNKETEDIQQESNIRKWVRFIFKI